MSETASSGRAGNSGGTPARPTARPARGGDATRGNVFVRLGVWYRQIVAELRKVIWPTRKELIAYTTVTLVFAAVMITLVASLDYGANWLILKVFG